MVRPEDIEKTPWPEHDFLERAAHYWQAYKAQKRIGVFDWPRYLLAGHAVEVALKALLWSRGYPNYPLRRLRSKEFGHDLEKLMQEAHKYGLKPSAKVKNDIADLGHVHGNYLARYPEYEGKTTHGRLNNPGCGIRAVKGLEPSIKWVLTEVSKLLRPKLIKRPPRRKSRSAK
jgi:hypothetical protein